MLKPIPQEQPEKAFGSIVKKTQNQSHPYGKKIPAGTNLPKSNPKIIAEAGKRLIAYSKSPENHSAPEIRDMIHSMQRVIVHLQRGRSGSHSGKKKK